MQNFSKKKNKTFGDRPLGHWGVDCRTLIWFVAPDCVRNSGSSSDVINMSVFVNSIT